MFALPKRIVKFRTKTHPPTHSILTHRAPVLALMRSLWTTASAQLLMAQCFLLANFKSCASEGCLDETHEMCYEVPWLSTSSHPIPHTTGHGVSALILGVLLATSPLTPKWRILALLVATCAELHAVVFLSANAAEVERATTRAASAQWGFALVECFPSILAAAHSALVTRERLARPPASRRLTLLFTMFLPRRGSAHTCLRESRLIGSNSCG